jgi:pimeloyl-[acyl-carrier protein] synthase
MRSLFDRIGWGRKNEDVPIRFQPDDPGFIFDPYPAYRALQTSEPLHRTPSGAWLLTRYEDVVAALADPRLGNAPSRYSVVHPRHRHRSVAADLANNILPFLDGEAHAGPRALVARSFHAQIKASPLGLEGIAEDILARLGKRDEFDVLADFATPFSLAAICDFLGLPREDGPQLKVYSEHFFFLFSRIPSTEALQDMDRQLAEFRRYVGEVVQARVREPRSDYISTLLAAMGGGERVVIDTIILIFADAIENVDRAIATAIWLLLKHPPAYRRLKDDPVLAGGAVDEVLRYDSPAQIIARVAREDIVWQGETIKAESAVLLALGAANRDVRQFEEPDRFAITRGPTAYLSFGKGKHSCIGGSLVKREMEAALQAFVAFAPAPTLLEQTPTWLPRQGHRWLAHLRLAR